MSQNGDRHVGTKALKTPVGAPKANAFCERFLGSVRRECLDQVLVLGERHLYETLVEYTGYFDRARTRAARRLRGRSSSRK
jgi:putative transposase